MVAKIFELFREKPDKAFFTDDVFIALEDVLCGLRSLKSESIDMIFADPPYNIGKKLLQKPMDKEKYLNWTTSWIDECMRVLKSSGTFYYMTATQFMPYIDCYVSEKYIVKQRIIWYYDSSGVQAKSYFGSMYEPILMIIKDKKQYKFHSDQVMVEAKTGSKRNLIDYRKTPPQPYNNKKVMGNVWYVPRVRFRMDEYENHPTQKPEKLMEIMINASSEEGDFILDPFGGSFTTANVALKMKRKAISFDIDEDFFKIGLRRLDLANEYKGLPLIKTKMRKTTNKSKSDHCKSNR